MATWAPTLNDVNPKDWTKDSRPISDLTADKSTAIALSGAGEIFGEAVKVTDNAFKDTIKQNVQSGVDNLRDAYTDSLQQVRNTQLAAADKSLLPDDSASANAPMQLQSGLDRIKQVGTAMAQNGSKINDTLYTGALNSMAKQLRAQYPGYRDYIDEQIQSVSGVNPANAFYKNLMEDINRNAENNKTENNAVKAQLRGLVNEGFRDNNGVTAADMHAAHDAGLVSNNGVEKWINSAKTLEWNNKSREDARKNRREDDADAIVSATKDLSVQSNQTINHAWTTMTIGKNTDTAESMFKFINENAGNQQVKDEKSQAIGEQLVRLRNQTFASVWADANKGGTNSLVTKLGGDPEKAKKIIENQFATWDNAIQSVFKGEWGAAYSHMNFNKAISADTTNILYNAPDEEVRKYNRMVGAINQISPQYAKDFFQRMLISDVPEREKEWLKGQSMELLTQPGQPQGKLTSAQGTLNDARARGVTSPKTYSKFIDNVNMISDPRIGEQQRLNAALGFFDPRYNTGLLSDKNFQMDYVDPATKRQVPGKYSVWTRLSSANVAAGIAELSKSHPEIGEMYKGMMSREFGEQLFRRDIQDAGATNRDFTVSNLNTSLYKIAYVDDGKQAPRLEFTDARGKPITMTQAIALNAPVGQINRLNTGMAGLHNVFKATGSTDPNTDILSTMYRYGYQDAKDVNNSQGRMGDYGITDIGKQIWGALIGAQRERMRKIKVSEPE